MAFPRPLRAFATALLLLLTFVLFHSFKSPPILTNLPGQKHKARPGDPNLQRRLMPMCETYCSITIVTEEPDGQLWRADDYGANKPNSPRINATILSLVRNEEVEGMVQAMKDLERTWNHKFNYPWTFFNDKPFTQEFKRKTQAETRAKCNYGDIFYIRHDSEMVLSFNYQNLSPPSIGRRPRGSTKLCSKNLPNYFPKIRYSTVT